MAYAAVISLKQTIHRLLNSTHISIVSSSREILQVAYKHLTSLQEALIKSDDQFRSSSNTFITLDRDVRCAVHEIEDLLESHILSIHVEEAVSPLALNLELALKEAWQDIISFPEAVKKMEQNYTRELERPFSKDKDDSADPQQTSIDADVKMVGLSDAYSDLKDHLTRVIRPEEFGFFSFLSSAGNGRSILADKVYKDIEERFDCAAWVRIGSTYELKRILLTIISKIAGVDDHEFLTSEGEDSLSKYLYESLEGKRYMVALDDVRNTEILMQLRRSFPKQDNGSLVFITTGIREVAELDETFFVYDLPTFMDEHFIWRYIRLMFFRDDEAISPEFEEIGRKIAKNCGGMRLVVARIMLILRKMKRTPENWGDLAAAQHDRVYVIDDEISEASDVEKYLGEEDQVWAKLLFDVSIIVERVKENLYPDRFFPKMGIMTVHGMAGVGKTALVMKLFQDPSIWRRFDHCAWVNVGFYYDSKEILVNILAQIYPLIGRTSMEEDATVVEDLCSQLSHKKCFIVLDDLWSQEPVDFLKRSLPNIKGELMITTRLTYKVGKFGPCDRVYKVRLLNIDESWDLLFDKVFGEEGICHPRLEKAGRKIAESCEGLPLVILVVADQLSEHEKTLEYWNMVATGEEPVVMNAQKKVSELLVKSYKSLPQHLKACFQYMGVFPQNSAISTSKLSKLWLVEGFLEPNPSQTFEDFASKCLRGLVYNNMVLVKKGSDLETNKTCYLHSVFWHLTRNEAINSKFFHIFKIRDSNEMESMKSHRRLCIPNSILLGIKNDDDDATTAFSTIRSLLCTGPPLQYQVPLCYDSKLLKVIEAVAIRFYEFPVEVVKLIQLRYLALTCDGKLPPSISRLWNLQFLIVRKNLSIISSSTSSYLPKEIWGMKELTHLQVPGNNLPSPDCDALLPNLSSLLDVSEDSCTKRHFKGFPNLKKLGIQIELEPNDNSNNLCYCLDHISHLSKLESLKCVVVNPDLGLEGVAPPIPSSMLPTSLKKLNLRGLGYPWEYMKVIGKLQNLEVLKLQCYAFVGPSWEIDHFEFLQLKSLSVEDADLVLWDIKTSIKLQFLSFKHCYNLEQLPSSLPTSVRMIQVVESHPSSENWAKQMKEINWERRMETLEIHLQSSWNE